MAMFVMEDMVRRMGIEDQFVISSSATSDEEYGAPVHRGTLTKLRAEGVPTYTRYATLFTRADYRDYDYIVCMDRSNHRALMRMTGGDPDQKVSMLLDYTERVGESIADPWYTGNFDDTYRDVVDGCEGLLRHLTDLHR